MLELEKLQYKSKIAAVILLGLVSKETGVLAFLVTKPWRTDTFMGGVICFFFLYKQKVLNIVKIHSQAYLRAQTLQPPYRSSRTFNFSASFQIFRTSCSEAEFAVHVEL